MSFLTTGGLVACILTERQACARLVQANQFRREQLSQQGKLQADNQRLSNLLARTSATPAPAKPLEPTRPTAETREQELVRLRGEAEALRRQSHEMETLQEDTRRVQSAPDSTHRSPNATSAAGNSEISSGTQFEILEAHYGTDQTNWDVADELRDRIRGDKLKAMASNNIKGDPHFGKSKRLTVVYCFGGATLTNEFNEGDVVILPKEQD